MSGGEILIRVYDGGTDGTCRGCGAAITWYETLTGKHMPIDAGAEPRRRTINVETHRTVAHFRAGDSHWASCPKREQFQRRPKT